jgi:hypothetical protein
MRRKKPTVLLLIADKWEALYVNGELAEQGAPLRSDVKVEYFNHMAEKHEFDYADIKEIKVDARDSALVNAQYVFPPRISMLFGKYQ